VQNKTAASGETECRRLKKFPDLLEREVQTAPDHAEVVVRTFQKVPADITRDTHVARNANLKAATHLASHATLILVVHKTTDYV
jgi:pyridoxal biosynthesis lyase PdxS